MAKQKDKPKRDRLSFVIRDHLADEVVAKALTMDTTPSSFCNACVWDCLVLMDAKVTAGAVLPVVQRYRLVVGLPTTMRLPDTALQRAKKAAEEEHERGKRKLRLWKAKRAKESKPPRLFLSIREDWTEDVRAKAAALKQNPNQFINECISDCLRAINAPEETFLPPIIDMYRRTTGRTDDYFARMRHMDTLLEPVYLKMAVEKGPMWEAFREWQKVPPHEYFAEFFLEYTAKMDTSELEGKSAERSPERKNNLIR